MAVKTDVKSPLPQLQLAHEYMAIAALSRKREEVPVICFMDGICCSPLRLASCGLARRPRHGLWLGPRLSLQPPAGHGAVDTGHAGVRHRAEPRRGLHSGPAGARGAGLYGAHWMADHRAGGLGIWPGHSSCSLGSLPKMLRACLRPSARGLRSSYRACGSSFRSWIGSLQTCHLHLDLFNYLLNSMYVSFKAFLVSPNITQIYNRIICDSDRGHWLGHLTRWFGLSEVLSGPVSSHRSLASLATALLRCLCERCQRKGGLREAETPAT